MIRTSPPVSVIIDTYNYADYIEHCIESVLNQEYDARSIEIVVVDDGSSDNTRDKVHKYKDKIKYIYKDNGGQASALNAGVEQSTGEYLVLLDSDDMMEPTRIEKVVSEFEKYREVGCVLNRRAIISENKTQYDGFTCFSNKRLNPENFELISGSGYGTSRTSMRRSSINNIFPLPEKGLKIEADLYLNLALLWFTNISSLEDYLTIYRIHGENLYCLTDVKKLPVQIESMTYALDYLNDKARQSDYFNPDILDKLVKPYQLELRYKKIIFGSESGKDQRLDLFMYELGNMRYRWKKWGYIYRFYKIITIPLILLVSSRRYLNLRDKYYSNEIYKIRESLFPNRT